MSNRTTQLEVPAARAPKPSATMEVPAGEIPDTTVVVAAPTKLTVRRCKLVAVGGPLSGREFLFEREVIRVGSKPDSDIVLEQDPTASRQHFEIRPNERGYLLVDVGSTNGTFLDGRRIERADLTAGSQVQAGKSVFAFARADEELSIEPEADSKLCKMIGKSLRMRQVFGLIRKIAPMGASVLVQGETGSGKELAARAIHELSPRKDKPLVVIDCSAIPPNLIEAELFGHEKGAFTGADKARPGAFERAQGGTVFLDELGELRLDLQPKLLRVLENREVRRLGSEQTLHVDVRVVAATNRDLPKEVEAGTFREDLYFRLAAITLALPPLRQRTDDIPLILRAAMDSPEFGELGSRKRFTPAALAVLTNYGWPGNIRELINVVSHVLTFTEGFEIDVPDLPARVLGKASTKTTLQFNEHLSYRSAKEKLLESFECEYLGELLRRCEGNISRAARESGLHRKSIERLVKKYRLDTRALKKR